VCNVEKEHLQELKIRALVCFSDPKYKTRTVERCSQHSGVDMLSHSHFLLSNEPTAAHENIKRQSSVLFTFVEGENKVAVDNGNTWQVKTAYQFMCHSSCPSINNLPLKVVFTLELG
jgi:P53 DNA-binding domain